MEKVFTADQLRVCCFDTRAQMGRAAALDCAAEINRQLEIKKEIAMIFAAAPSQNEFLEALVALGQQGQVDFSRVRAFHMDEYVGLPADAPQGFGNFLRQRLFDRLPFKAVHYLNSQADDPQAECRRYGNLLSQYPCNIVCMGIGENGHIAFNDPHEADFHDPCPVKIVSLDETCRMQQVHDGCFDGLSRVPTHALTLTIPVLTAPEAIFCVVPAASKAAAVQKAVEGPVSESCPASILRRHPHASLYLDGDSAKMLNLPR